MPRQPSIVLEPSIASLLYAISLATLGAMATGQLSATCQIDTTTSI